LLDKGRNSPSLVINISVVMSVHNGAQYLREAVESILNQTFTDFEFIIINDGSTDRTREILESYCDERIILIHQNNSGLTKALNIGIARARGRYIARQDSDDVSESDRLHNQIEYLRAHPETAVLGTAVTFIGPAGQTLGISRHPLDHDAITRELKVRNCFWHGSIMFLKSAFDAVGGYSEIFTATQDYDLWLRLSERHRVANLPIPLYRYRFNPNAVTFRRLVTQKKLADLARRLAEARLAGEDGSAIIANIMKSHASLTRKEKAELFSAYMGWVHILHRHALFDEAYALIGKILRYHPSILFRLCYGMIRPFRRAWSVEKLVTASQLPAG